MKLLNNRFLAVIFFIFFIDNHKKLFYNPNIKGDKI